VIGVKMARTVTIEVPQEFAGMRLDNFLARHFPDLSRSRCQQVIRDGRVRIEGIIVTKPGFILRGKERIEVELPEPEPSTLQPEPIPLSVLYEDDDLACH
jgi:23S rRNA pseudouridine1911/1915/1917 synthase